MTAALLLEGFASTMLWRKPPQPPCCQTTASVQSSQNPPARRTAAGMQEELAGPALLMRRYTSVNPPSLHTRVGWKNSRCFPDTGANSKAATSPPGPLLRPLQRHPLPQQHLPGFHDDTKCTGTSAAITARKNFANCASSFVIFMRSESGSPSLHQTRPFLGTAHNRASALHTFCAPTSIKIQPRCTSDKLHCSCTTNAASKQRCNSSLCPASRLCSTNFRFMRQRNQEHINGFSHFAPAVNQQSLPSSPRRSNPALPQHALPFFASE